MIGHDVLEKVVNKMEFRPCIDLHDGKVKQIVGSTLGYKDQAVVENFSSEHDSSYYAQLFQENKLTGGHVIMLGPGNEDAAIRALQSYPKGLQVGGGITANNAKNISMQGHPMSSLHPIFSMMACFIWNV